MADPTETRPDSQEADARPAPSPSSPTASLARPPDRVPRFIPRRPPQPQNLGATRQSDRSPLHLKPAQITELFGLIARHRYRYYRYRDLALVALSYYFGLRASEPGRILLSHLRLEGPHPEIVLRGAKRGTTQVYYLPRHLVDILQAYLQIRRFPGGVVRAQVPPDQDFLFPGRWGKPAAGRVCVTPIGNKMVNYVTKRYLAQLRHPLPGASHHILRHSIATHLADAGFDVTQIAHHLRQKSIVSAQVYIAMSTEARQTVARAMDTSGHFGRLPGFGGGAALDSPPPVA